MSGVCISMSTVKNRMSQALVFFCILAHPWSLNGKLVRSNALANDNQRDRRGNDLEEPVIKTDKADQSFMPVANSIVFGTDN